MLRALPSRQSPTQFCCFNFLFLFCLMFIWWQQKDCIPIRWLILETRNYIQDGQNNRQSFLLPLVSSFPTSLPGFLHFASLSWRNPSATENYSKKLNFRSNKSQHFAYIMWKPSLKKRYVTYRVMDRQFSLLPHPYSPLSPHFNLFPSHYLCCRTQKSARNPSHIQSSEILLLCTL